MGGSIGRHTARCRVKLRPGPHTECGGAEAERGADVAFRSVTLEPETEPVEVGVNSVVRPAVGLMPVSHRQASVTVPLCAKRRDAETSAALLTNNEM